MFAKSSDTYSLTSFHHVIPKIILVSKVLSHGRGGGRFLQRKGTWGCAASKGRVYFFRLLSLVKGIHFGNFSLGKAMYAFSLFRSEKGQILVIPVEKLKIFATLVWRRPKFGNVSLQSWTQISGLLLDLSIPPSPKINVVMSVKFQP